MTAITGGTVSVEDCKKHDGYPDPQFAPTRKVRVELIFVVPEGQDGKPYLDGVAAEADAKVAELLGRKPAAKQATPATTTGFVQEASTARGKAEIEAEALARMNGGQAPSTAPAAAKGPKRGGAKEAKDTPPAAASTEPPKAKADPDELTETAASEPAKADPDDLGDLTGSAVKADPITDLELNNAVQKRNAIIKSGVTIRKLVQKFNPDTAKFPTIVLAQIPQGKRAEFLKDLETLQAE